MSFDQLKQQILTIFAVKGGGDGGVMGLIWGMVVLQIVEMIIGVTPLILNQTKELFRKKMESKITSTIIPRSAISCITFTKYFGGSDKKDENLSDAILDYVCKQNSAIALRYMQFYIVNKKEVFPITKDIDFRLISEEFKDGKPSILIFEIFSYKLNLTELKGWINSIFKEYEIEKTNQLGDKQYFFDELKAGSGPSVSPDYSLFTMREFDTNKSLKTIYGSHVDLIRQRVKLFTENPQWYQEKGIPHTLGILLHGPPGTGKTSIIKAIAKDTKRHLINIKLNKNTTVDQMNDLFYNENIKVYKNNTPSCVVIPMKKRIYVMEDIDCLSEIVLDRSLQKEDEKKPATNNNNYYQGQQDPRPKKETININYLLNLFDGVMETPGRIIIMTSNYPEKLDKALVRPGRIDVNLLMGYCDESMVGQMYKSFYGEEREFDGIKEKQITPARIQALLSYYMDNPNGAYDAIMNYKED